MFSEFKERRMQIYKLKPELRRNIICLLTSIILHVLLVFIFINVASPVKVIQFREEVTDLIIVPPEALLLPEGYEDFPGTGLYDEPFLGRRSRERRSSSREELSEIESAIEAEIPPMPEREIPPSQAESAQAPLLKGRLTYRSGLASEFKLKIPAESDLDLSKTSKEEQEIGGVYEERRRIDFSKYTRSDLSAILSSKGQTLSGRPGTGRTGRRTRASFKVQNYDITPWAERVVNRIQSNWKIPIQQAVSVSQAVGVSVIIDKNGKLTSIEILSSSRVDSLDQAAIEAIRSSSPFPSLPDDFPYKNLEAFFVFQYYD